jgi:hypothetical protein
MRVLLNVQVIRICIFIKNLKKRCMLNYKRGNIIEKKSLKMETGFKGCLKPGEGIYL